MASPYKQPKELKKLKGTHRKDKDLPGEISIKPLTTIPPPPEDLPEKAQKTWYNVCSQLAALKILTSLDLDALKAYCFQIYTMDESIKVLKEEGFTVIMTNKGGGSYPVKSPYITIYNDALSHVNRIGQQFGFSPSSRTKISVGQIQEEKKNSFDGL